MSLAFVRGRQTRFELGITEIGCMAHARRKFFDLHVANKSQFAEQALHSIGGLYEIERQAKEMNDEDRRRLRQEILLTPTKGFSALPGASDYN